MVVGFSLVRGGMPLNKRIKIENINNKDNMEYGHSVWKLRDFQESACVRSQGSHKGSQKNVHVDNMLQDILHQSEKEGNFGNHATMRQK